MSANARSQEGGPAFPVPNLRNSVGQELTGASGMSLRDYFAAAALSGVVAKCSYEDMKKFSSDELRRMTATACYNIADEMIKAREATSE